MAQVRYFAAAAEAAGCSAESVDAATLGELASALDAAHGPYFTRVRERCALLVDGLRTTEAETPLGPSSSVDVLPPFAGG